jgi:hypothetical protein
MPRRPANTAGTGTLQALSGATTKRPTPLRCLKKLEHGDTLIVWKLDRLGRSFRPQKRKGLTLLIGGKRYAAFPPKPKSEAPATEGKGA